MFAKIRLVAAAVVTGALVAVTGGCGILSPSPAETCMYPQVGAVAEVGDEGVEAVDFRGNCATAAELAEGREIARGLLNDARTYVSTTGAQGAVDVQQLVCDAVDNPAFQVTQDDLDDLLEEQIPEAYRYYNLPPTPPTLEACG